MARLSVLFSIVGCLAISVQTNGAIPGNNFINRRVGSFFK